MVVRILKVIKIKKEGYELEVAEGRGAGWIERERGEGE